MAFGDVLSGLAQASHAHHTNLLKLEYDKKRELAQQYGRISEDNSYPEEMRTEALKRALTIHTMEPYKKLPKEFESFMFHVPAKKPDPIAIRGSVGMEGAPIPTGREGSRVPNLGEVGDATSLEAIRGDQFRPGAETDILPRSVQPPDIPEHDEQMAPMPFNEQMRRATQESIAKSAGASGIAQMKASIPEKVGTYTAVDADGKRYQTTRWRIPLDGKTFETRAENDQAYAYRGGAPLDVEDAYRLKQLGLPNYIMNPTMEQYEAIRQAVPGIDLRADAANPGLFFFQTSPAKMLGSIGGYQYAGQGLAPTNQPMAGAQNLGPTTSTLPQTRVAPQARGVDPATRLLYFTDATTRTTRDTPGAFGVPAPAGAPTAPPGMAAPQQQQAPPPVPRGTPLPGGMAPPILMPQIPGIPGQAPAPTAPPDFQADPAVVQEIQNRLQGLDLKGAELQLGPAQLLRQPYQAAYLKKDYVQPFLQEYARTQGGAQPNAGMSQGMAAKEFEMETSISPAARMLFGDPGSPLFESLESFGSMMDDEGSRKRVGDAFRVIKEGLATVHRGGGESASFGLLGRSIGAGLTGDFAGIVKNFLGVPQYIGAAERGTIEKTLGTMNDKEKRFLARLIAAYGTIVGIRKITSGGAYQFATDAMEREIPVPGVTGANDSKSYYNKLAQLAEEISTPAEMMLSMPPQKKQFYAAAALRLTIKGRADDILEVNGLPPLYWVDGKWYDEKGVPH